MGTIADTLFNGLMSWVRALVNALWALVSADHTTVLAFLGKNWLIIAAVMIAAGLVIDWIIWLLRWQPYHLWAQRARRLLRIEEPEAQEEEEAPRRARAAAMPPRRDPYAPPRDVQPELFIDERDVMARAEQAPDEYAYPGMRYDSAAPEGAQAGTQRYSALTQEGPGAAEVERRRAEIEAWRRQEEARAAAQRAERERLAQQERERQTQERERQAQAEYARQLAEYERQKAQYELELAEYERQKAEYEAYLAREAAQQQEQAEEVAPAASRRRRGAQRMYSDYVEGETVSELPDAPDWPQMPAQTEAAHQTEVPTQEANRKGSLLGRMAKMIEPEEEQIISRTKLPPRVNVQDAYKPAATPTGKGRRHG